MYGQTWEGTRQIGDYLLLDIIGEGGMAIVWKATQRTTQREVAFKMLKLGMLPPKDMEIIRRRFLREVKTLSFLQHPAIVPILDYGEEEGIPYLVMPLLPGGTLQDIAAEGPRPWCEAVRLILPIAEALAYAHEQGIIHRDVKPSNILLDDQGQPLLSDFGVARLLDREATTKLTTTGVSLGTPAYMAPEQAMGKEVDGRADVYSLACVLYELLTGEPPYTADTPMGVLLQHLQAPPPSLTSKAPHAPKALEHLLIKALAKEPKERPTMAAFRRALEAILEKDTRRNIILWPPPIRRKAWLVAAVLVLFGLGIGIEFPYAWGKGKATPTSSATVITTDRAAAHQMGGIRSPTPTVEMTSSPTPTLSPSPLPPTANTTPTSSAASSFATATPSAVTASATPTLTPSPTPFPTPIPTATPTPTWTATPTPTPTLTPLPVPSPTPTIKGWRKTPTPTP